MSADDTPILPAPPRLWPVFVAPVVAVVVGIVAQVILAIIVAIYMVATGQQDRLQHLDEVLTEPGLFILMAALSQVPIGLAAVVGGVLSRESFTHRLGLVPTALPWYTWPAVLIGSWFPAGVGLGLAYLLSLVLDPDLTAAQLYAQMTWGIAPVFILFIALAPGFFEEMLFRGYMQRRLLQRWPVWLAILVTSALFAAVHIIPHTVVFAFPIGIWLGVVAWRTGSIWPCILSHAFINGTWNIYQVGVALGEFPDEPPDDVAYGVVVAVLVCFVAAVWLIVRCPPRVACYDEPKPVLLAD